MPADERVLTGVRASSLVRCVRAAFFQAVDAPSEEHSATVLKRFERGAKFGRIAAEEQAEHLEAKGLHPVLEAEVSWGRGWTGHADVLVPETRVIVEAISTAGAVMRPTKAIQASPARTRIPTG